MNPLEYLDALEEMQLSKIKQDSKQQYTKDEVINLLKEVGIGYRKSIYNGEYILNLDTLQKSNITIKDTEFAIQKIITDDDKYLLFIQITDILDESFSEEDLAIMAEEIQRAVKKSNNIAGVVILPSNMEISLITAKLETLSYAKTLKFTEQDFDFIKSLNLKPDENGVIDYRKTIIETLGDYYKNESTASDNFASPYTTLSSSLNNRSSSVLDKYFY